MKKTLGMLRAAAVVALACASQAPAFAALGIAEDFQTGLGGWTDRDPRSPESAVVADPLDAGNNVLSFLRLGYGGSLMSNTAVTSSGLFTISFDYLGQPGKGGVAGNLGGYLGVSSGVFSGGEMWLAGTGGGTPIDLIDDGSWHHYTLTFRSTIGQSLHVMIEDFDGSGGVAGDVYFDNVRITSAVPEPTSVAMALVGLVGLAAVRRRANRA